MKSLQVIQKYVMESLILDIWHSNNMLFLETLDPFPAYILWLSSTHLSLDILTIHQLSSEIISNTAPLTCMLE